jgi:hypothetical protein
MDKYIVTDLIKYVISEYTDYYVCMYTTTLGLNKNRIKTIQKNNIGFDESLYSGMETIIDNITVAFTGINKHNFKIYITTHLARKFAKVIIAHPNGQLSRKYTGFVNGEFCKTTYLPLFIYIDKYDKYINRHFFRNKITNTKNMTIYEKIINNFDDSEYYHYLSNRFDNILE